MTSASPRKLLVRVVNAKLGDCLMATPVLRALRREHPACEITLMLSPPGKPADWVRTLPSVDRIYWDECSRESATWRDTLRLVRCLRAERFDAVLDLRYRSRCGWAYFLAGIPIRIGSSEKLYGRLLTHNLRLRYLPAERNEVEYSFTLAEPLNVTGEPGPLELPIPPESEEQARSLLAEVAPDPDQPLVAITTGFGGSSRRWPPERWEETARRLALGEGCRVLLVDGPDGAETNAAIAANIGDSVVDLTGRTDVTTLAALLRHCALHLSITTGTSHVAAAMGTPCVTLFPLTENWLSARRWGPWQTRHILLGPRALCGGCTAERCRGTDDLCIESILVDDVVQAARALLGRGEAPACGLSFPASEAANPVALK